MATFPVATGDVLTAAVYNSLTAFTVDADATAGLGALTKDSNVYYRRVLVDNIL